MKSTLSIALGVALGVVAPLLQAQEYPLSSDSQPNPAVAKGTLTKYELAPGVYYPGSPHPYAVYAPAGYDATRPSPFMVFLDEAIMLETMNIPTVLDNLIAKHELPPMVAVLVDFGVLPTLSEGAQNRYERAFEYDSLSDRYASFLVNELIPEVAKNYPLSNNPDDRATAGLSSSAVGAFMAAWHRPDQFHRVLSFIGTYVNMKGADALPALVRKTEPKPLRVLLQDGRNDHIVPSQPFGTFYAGSWPINNQVMFEALQFAGYDAKLVMGDGGHDLKQAAAMLPDALRWLWHDYPSPIAVKEPAYFGQPGSDPRGTVYSTVSASKDWEQVGDAYGAVTSPAGDRQGNVFFSDAVAERIYKVEAANGQVRLFTEKLGGGAALEVGPDGRLYAAQPARKRIVSYGVNGADERVAARNVEADALALTAKGTIYFADCRHKLIGYVDEKGNARTVYEGGDIAFPSGLALSPDQAMLIVSDAQERFSWSFQIAADGSLRYGEPFYRLEVPESGSRGEVRSPTVDSQGQVYFATAVGLQVCEANGRAAQILNAPRPGRISGIAFGGKDLDWLYAAEEGRLFRRPVKVKGVPVEAPVKPPKPLL